MAAKSPTARTTRRRLQALGADAPPIGPGAPPMGAGIGVDVDADTLDEHLPSLTKLIEERAFSGDDGPHIIRITRDGLTEDGIDVGLRLIDDIDDIDDSVVSALIGFTAPAEWLAIGVSTGANAYPLDDGPEAPRRRARLVHLVTRRGAAASVVRLAGEEARVLIGSAHDGTVVGRVDDVCRRALGIPTAAAAGTLEFSALMWLDALVASGTQGAPATWADVAAKHPAVRVFVESEPDLVPEASASLARLGLLSAAIHGWSELRSECVAGRWPVDGVSPEVARWLDDGAFSRWVMGTLPPLDQLTVAAC